MTQETTARPVERFVVRAIPAEVLEQVRAAGADGFGNALAVSVAPDSGSPLRCCLRDAAAGERIALIGYRPFPWNGVYAETGPLFVHAEPCDGYNEPDVYPADFRHRQQIFRAYGHDRTIVDARVVDGADAEQAIADFLSRPEVDFIHSRNVAYGCYMFTIQRS